MPGAKWSVIYHEEIRKKNHRENTLQGTQGIFASTGEVLHKQHFWGQNGVTAGGCHPEVYMKDDVVHR